MLMAAPCRSAGGAPARSIASSGSAGGPPALRRLPSQFQPAAAQIERVARGAGLENLWVQRIDDKLALLLIDDQPRFAQHAQMVRDVRQLHIQQSSQFADVARSGLQALDDLEPFRVADRLQGSSALIGTQLVAH